MGNPLISIGVIGGDDLINRLKEKLSYDFVNPLEEGREFKILIIKLDRDSNFYENLKFYYNLNVSLIILLEKDNIKEMRSLFLLNIVDDCILKDDYFEIEKSIKISLNKRKNCRQFFINDTYQKGIIDFNEIKYIDFSRIERRVNFHLEDKNVFSLKRTFGSVEKKLKDIRDFFKIERGLIVNLEQIKILDYREERIIFKDYSCLYISKIKLKKLEEQKSLMGNKIII
ncbi:LytTR family transcriptional regulator DNA-binding domain-containing protein [Fusobacterium sp. IOR10]|uniref:LytTR family transcriptional regulator DNA-binding domain-containing protein n=1 Tax=Fusobacterium sp. IOR10 TaxID=2665157 RepID=UPI0013D3797A|nr:LytTR family transcriptional regulator DNA-binding domain-containing protein [Fusobacterium sp. IOR10]